MYQMWYNLKCVCHSIQWQVKVWLGHRCCQNCHFFEKNHRDLPTWGRCAFFRTFPSKPFWVDPYLVNNVEGQCCAAWKRAR